MYMRALEMPVGADAWDGDREFMYPGVGARPAGLRIHRCRSKERVPYQQGTEGLRRLGGGAEFLSANLVASWSPIE